MVDSNEVKIGTVVIYEKARGFGFIEEANGYRNFFHIRDFVPRYIPKIGQLVTFRMGEGKRGLAAMDVTPIDDVPGSSALAGGGK